MIVTRRLQHFFPLYPVLGLLGACSAGFSSVVPACTSSIYCTGDLLEKVQLARIFQDSKTFVDLQLKYNVNITLDEFEKLMRETDNRPSNDQLMAFVDNAFVEGNELNIWNPPDFDPEPPVLKRINDPKLREFAKNVISIWVQLGRRVVPEVAQNPDKYSFLYVPNGFIVPGGRFKEIYYWDSFWMVRGLLISNMKDTAKGMIENLLYLVDKIGYIPNGSRVYYLGRSQPPLLAAMVSAYLSATGDVGWLKNHISTIEKELQYWLDKKKVTLEVKGKKYILLRYKADNTNPGPRPESYYEDHTIAASLPSEDMRKDFYSEIRSAAESGWDFSTRWFVKADNDSIGRLTDIHTTRILPVDLNSIFAGALQIAGDLRNRLRDRREAIKWWSLAKYWRKAIEEVLWDPDDGVWYDFDTQTQSRRKHFYPSCVTPLWAGAVEQESAQLHASRLVTYLMSSGGLEFPGGVPTSVLYSGEQWDYPNAWPPLQSILIGGLQRSGHKEAQRLAKEQARIWIRANYLGYSKWHKMFEKYSAVDAGHHGGGGEYMVQDGFGWTNGVALELLDMYGGELFVDNEMGSNYTPQALQLK